MKGCGDGGATHPEQSTPAGSSPKTCIRVALPRWIIITFGHTIETQSATKYCFTRTTGNINKMDRYMSRAREVQAPSSTASVRGSFSEEHSYQDASTFSGPSTLFAQSTSVVAEQWKRATEMLSSHPSLMTNRILCMALKHRPPFHIVKCMLKLNPKAANLQEGDQPTALQVAIQSKCSVLVVECLIRACPLALVETAVIDLGNGNYAHLDPLSYARRYRPTDEELLRVLCLPLSHWMEQGKMVNDQSTSGWSSGDESSSFMGCTSSSGFPTSGLHSISSSSSSFSHRERDNSSAAMTSSSSDCNITPPRRLHQPTITVSPDEEPVQATTSDLPVSPVRTTVASLAGMSAAVVTSFMDSGTESSTYSSNLESPVGTLGAAPRPASVRWASPLQTFLSSAKCSGSLSTTASETSYNLSSFAIPSRKLSSRSTSNSTAIDPQEVANVKLICMAVLRGHRRLSAQLKSIMEEMSNHHHHHDEVNVPEEILQYLDEMQEEILRKMEENMDEQLRSQLIALDMKEQHFRANVHRMERKLVRKVSKKQSMLNEQVVNERLENVMQVSRTRMKGFQERLDRMERLLLLEERARNLKEKEHLYHSSSKHIPGLLRLESNSSGNSNHRVCEESTKPLLGSNPRRRRTRDLVETRNPSPVVFASPLTEIAYDDNRDDVRSLLTEDSFVARQDPKKPLRTHPLLQLLCKV